MVIRITSLSKLSALLLLIEKPRHGYELIMDIRSRFGYPVSAGQVYPFLSSLARVKFVTIKAGANRDKKIYSLTSNGREFANKVVDNFDELIELAIAKKVHKCAHCGCRVLGGGYKEKKTGKIIYFCCASCAASFTP